MRRPRFVGALGGLVRARPRTAIAVGAGGLVLLVVAGILVRSLRRHSAEPPPEVAPPPVELVSGPAPRPTTVVHLGETCVTPACHATFRDDAFHHAPIAANACGTCHADDSGGHVYPLAHPKDALCSGCHSIAEKHRFQHKAMSDDGCLACHTPHSGKDRMLLRQGTTTATCAQCHPRLDAPKSHKPYAAGSCDSCHDPHGADNPTLIFGGEGLDQCRQCHADIVDRVETSLHSHCAIERGCLACHSPHAAEHDGLLPAPPRDLCVTCHPDVGKTVGAATVSHDAVLAGHQCVNCHDPHASDHPKMLRDSQAKVCLSCHDKAVKATDGRQIPEMATALAAAPVVHGAIRHGDCSACHSMHGGEHARLLKEALPNVPLGPYDARNYALCFSCHDPKLAERASATQFRDGNKNLHEIHLRGDERSSGCGSCHTVHTGELPRLIAKTVNFQGSGWAMPIDFTITEDGGSCTPGCHEPLAYSRRPGGAKGQAKPAPPAGPDDTKGRSP